MRIPHRSNLTISLLRQQSYGELGVPDPAPQPACVPTPTPVLRSGRQQDRVDFVHPGPRVHGAQVLGYIFDQPGVLYPRPVGTARCSAQPVDRGENDKVPPPPPAVPNPAPQPADGSTGGVLNLYA
jgi:hypothetical protein